MKTSIEYPEAVAVHLAGINALDSDPTTTTAVEFASASEAGRKLYDNTTGLGLITSMIAAHKAEAEAFFARYGISWDQVDVDAWKAGVKGAVSADLKDWDDEYGWDFERFTEHQEDVIFYEWFPGKVCDAIFDADPDL